ncbi:MAG: glycosyltransferase family 1 protein, partial [Alphaproteobacteria bacterium]|nr:glycosyltransferase family 1 protein [Alphaproteobacteria bacterium]
HLVAQSSFDETVYDAVIHFNPFYAPHKNSKNILYLQNAFPPEQYEGGTIGVFNRARANFDGYMFTSDTLMKACADGAVVPFATDPEMFYPQPDDRYRHTVSIVGNDIRGPVVNERYFSPALPFGLAIYSKTGWAGRLGEAWRGGLPQEDLPRLYSSSIVNLNAHISDHLTWQTINLRIFDVLACGGFILSDDMPALREVFGDAICYTDGYEEEWAKLVCYISDTQKRQACAEAGRKIVLSGHTYAHRAAVIMQYLKETL